MYGDVMHVAPSAMKAIIPQRTSERERERESDGEVEERSSGGGGPWRLIPTPLFSLSLAPLPISNANDSPKAINATCSQPRGQAHYTHNFTSLHVCPRRIQPFAKNTSPAHLDSANGTRATEMMNYPVTEKLIIFRGLRK